MSDMVPRSRIAAIERETEKVEAKLADVQKSARQEIERLSAKVGELEGEIVNLKSDVDSYMAIANGEMNGRLELEARIDPAEKLPNEWRNVHCGEQRCKDTFDGCADELEAALHPQELSDG